MTRIYCFLLLISIIICTNDSPETITIMDGTIIAYLSHKRKLEYKVNKFLTLKTGCICVYRGEYLNLPIHVYRFHTDMAKIHKRNLMKRFCGMMVKNIANDIINKTRLAYYKESITNMTNTLADMKRYDNILWYTFHNSIFQEQDSTNKTYTVNRNSCTYCGDYFRLAMKKFCFK